MQWTTLVNVVNETGIGVICVEDLCRRTWWRRRSSCGLCRMVGQPTDLRIDQYAAVSFQVGVATALTPAGTNATRLVTVITNITDIPIIDGHGTPTAMGSMSKS